MSHLRIPASWKVKRSTPFFTKQNVPAALLTHHNTAAGVFGQLCVMEGTVTIMVSPTNRRQSLKQRSLSTPDSSRPARRSTGTALNLATTRSSILTFGLQMTPTVKAGYSTRRKAN